LSINAENAEILVLEEVYRLVQFHAWLALHLLIVAYLIDIFHVSAIALFCISYNERQYKNGHNGYFNKVLEYF